MTVYPLVFNVGPLMITGFGIMMMIGFLMAAWVMQRYLLEKGYSPAYAEHAIIASVVGGIIGAKLWYVFLHGPEHLLSRGGLVWNGGFIGGAVAVILTGYRLRVPLRFTMDMGSLALALGHGIGRVGCWLIQDDYGVPTSLPWGMRFPQGYPPSTAADLRRLGVDIPADIPPTEVLAVHPTQLYEVAALLFIFWLLWRLRDHKHGAGFMFAVYLVAVGIERFLVEFIRAKDDRLLGGFTLAQGMSVVLFLLGVALMVKWWEKDDLQIPKEATVLHAKADSS